MSLTLVRAGAVLLALIGLCVALRFRRRTLDVLRRFWLEPTSPVNVAVLRIIVFHLLMRSAIGQNPVWYTRLPESERNLPPGWGWLGDLPFHEGLAGGAEFALIVTGALATLGVFTRVTAPLAAVLAVYVLGLPNFFSKINHGHHIRVLCALAIACSPCGDALSIDRLWKRLRGHDPPAPSLAYTVPVRVAWLLVATVYLFPGLGKLWVSGDLWISGKQLKNLLLIKWATLPDYEPLYRIDRHEWLMVLLGVGTLVFEIGFAFALFHRTTRTIAAFSAVAFHVGIAAFMSIRFSPYFPLILLLEIPERWKAVRGHLPAALLSAASKSRARPAGWASELRERIFRPKPPRRWPERSARLAALGGMVLLLGQTFAGLASVNSWPISAYPMFSTRHARTPKTGSILRFYLESDDGDRVDLNKYLGRLGSGRLQKMLKNVKDGVRHDTERGRSAVELFRHSGVRLEPGHRISIYEASWNVLPPGQRSAYREKLSRRFVVEADGSLTAERASKSRPRGTSSP